MANYRETTVQGSSWIRCNTVTIKNPLVKDTNMFEGVPRVFFQEEQVVNIKDTSMLLNYGSCHKAFDPSAQIPIRDPETNEFTGTTVSHMELYNILYSLYLQTAEERDARQV